MAGPIDLLVEGFLGVADWRKARIITYEAHEQQHG